MDNEMEACEKLRSISDGLKVLQDGCAGRVRPQLRKFVDRENFASHRMYPISHDFALYYNESHL